MPRASALVRGMPVLDAQSSMPFTLLEKHMMGGGEESADMVDRERRREDGRGQRERVG